MEKNAKIYIAGHRGLVGSAITRELKKQGYTNLVVRSHNELDLEDQQATQAFFDEESPDYVFLAAGKVGGIAANEKYPAEFIYRNVMILTNVIHQAYTHQVKKLLLLGSSCIYPRMAAQPIKEESFMGGALEPTNDAYALSKITAIKMCQAYNQQYGTHYISVMPTNLYGIEDNFNLETSHVLPALLRKFHEAKMAGDPQVVMWGTGSPVREFLYVDDLANACVYLMNTYSDSKIVNVGTGTGITIRELAEKIKETVGYTGKIVNDTTKPDGTPIKINDVSYLNSLGWKASTDLIAGLKQTYEWYLKKSL